MTSFTGAFLLAYLLSASFTDQVQLNITSVQKLVDYQYNLAFEQVIPGKLYNGSIVATWAVPQSSISGIDGQTVSVKVTATTEQNSTLFFPMLSGTEAKEATIYLRCDVQNGTCANTSILSAQIPVLASALPDSAQSVNISLRSELAEGSPEIVQNAQGSAQSIFDSFKNAFLNSSGNESGLVSIESNSSPELLNATNETVNILDTLKPEGDSNDPVSFLKENPLISLTALVIVIVITGAYLLNARD